jgi:predicted Rossmann fold nucleotide-binding protein DprA/Smf involved in DNA uptake
MNQSATRVILLLNAILENDSKSAARPLSFQEYGTFAAWLKDQGKRPDDLLKLDVAKPNFANSPIDKKRLFVLLERGPLLDHVLQKWMKNGIWVITRSDAAYPKRLKERLGRSAPALLFGCGEAQLLEKGGIAAVGSRDATPSDLDYAKSIGRHATAQNIPLISGSARGVDEAAMLGALESGGRAIGVVAMGLSRPAHWALQYLADKRLTLVSPFAPEDGFVPKQAATGRLMGRNRFIYCLSDLAVIVACKKGQGGTWAGAMENLKAGWVPSFVRSEDDVSGGFAEMLNHGAKIFRFERAPLRNENVIHPGNSAPAATLI